MIYDVLIIGAGIEGSSAGYNLVKNESDKNIVILEQVTVYDLVCNFATKSGPGHRQLIHY